MSRLYPDKKPPKPKVTCISCAEFDDVDSFCPVFQKDIYDMCEKRACRRHVKIKEASP